jgi:predicted metal-dependent peptidase
MNDILHAADTGTAGTGHIPGMRTATDAEADRFSLDAHLINLMMTEPFFSKVLRPITKVRTDEIPTAGVLAKDGDIRMWWNPKFLASLTSKQVKGLLKHECYHLVFEHTTTRRHEPHIVWNYATDLAINSLIDEEELPEGGLIPGKAFKALTEEDKTKMGPEAVKRYELVSAKIAGFPKEMSAEWYFARLMEDEDVKEALEGSPGGEGDGEPGEGGAPGLPGSMDSHDGWDEMSAGDREYLKQKIKQSIEKAVKECDATGGWGSVGAKCQKQIRAMISNEIPWQSVIKKFCGMIRRAHRRSSVKRLHRKYPGIHPGMQKGYTASIYVYIDQSGSVGEKELQLLFGELGSLAKNIAFTTFHFDTSVDENSKTEWKKGRIPPVHRTRHGGTCFNAVAEHAAANKKDMDGYLILTDGYAPDPGPSRIKRGWVITPGGSTEQVKGNARDFFIMTKFPKQAA